MLFDSEGREIIGREIIAEAKGTITVVALSALKTQLRKPFAGSFW